MEPEKKTAGIDPATAGALHVLQFARPGTPMEAEVPRAASEVASYHPPSGPEQVMLYNGLQDALADFLEAIVRLCPDGPERSTAISRAREAKMWAAAAVAMEGR